MATNYEYRISLEQIGTAVIADLARLQVLETTADEVPGTVYWDYDGSQYWWDGDSVWLWNPGQENERILSAIGITAARTIVLIDIQRRRSYRFQERIVNS